MKSYVSDKTRFPKEFNSLELSKDSISTHFVASMFTEKCNDIITSVV